MARRPYPFQYVDIHGRPFGSFGAAKPRPNSAADQPREEKKPPVAPSAADLERVFDAVVLASWRRGKTALTTLLRALQWRRERGGSFDGADVGAALRRLVVDGRAQALEDEGWSVPAPAAEARLAELLQQPEAMGWWRVWLWVADGANGPIERLPYYFSPRNDDESVALLRLVLISGVDGPGFDQLCSGPLRSVFVIGPLSSAVAQLLHLQLTARVNPALWWRLLSSLDQHGMLARQAALRDWIEANLHAAPPGNATSLRLRVAEQRLHRGDTAGVQQAIADDAAAANFLPLMQALLPAHAGRFADTVAAFPPAWKALTSLLGRRRGFAPMSLLQWYPLALMAQPDAAAWTAARKFCVAASGSRNPPADDDWGRWAHVLAVRLGDERLQPAVLMPDPPDRQLSRAPDRLADRLVLAAWLGQRSAAWTLAQSQALLGALCDAGLPWKADLVLQACVQLGGPVPARPDGAPPPWPVAYFSKRQDAWREALAAIVALGDGRSASVDKPLETLRWLLTLDDDGRVSDLQAFEPAATARGKPKLLTLLQLKKRNRLDPRDAAVARCLRQGRYRANELSLDLVQAAMALQGHPALAFHDAPDVAVELVESLPVLEVRRERAAGAEGEERFVFRLHDALQVAADPALEHHLPDYDQIDAEVERRNGLRVVRDAPDRARLLRVTPAQRRVAELVAQGWTVPADAGAELDAALRVLSGHFMLHSDAAAGEAVPSDARLVAQLQPRGDALRLTLAVRPFGDFGPQLAPGHGRVRLMTLRAGVSLATERALPTEREHLATVLDLLPFLADASGEAPADATWSLDDPEQALAAVHHLGRLATESRAVRALEWPKGRPVSVLAPEARAFSTTLASRRDWFALQGELRVDEQRVLSLQQLLALLRDAQGSRYVALGEGRYLLLADQLRQRLAELDALAEAGKDGLLLGTSASAWLVDAASDLGLQGDTAWHQRAADLERAGALQPVVPPGLQAQLRPYQTEGHDWMRRLAEAGFGAILADDMGLGKTVQTLAVLLARAEAGPALVVAPTSVCDNWAAEARRFAPALRCSVHGRSDSRIDGRNDSRSDGRNDGRNDGPRAAQVAAAGPGDLLVVSYALLLRDAEAFAARPWATLVLDEAQALKNAATQRVQAVAALQAGFRLALSGTPVENRLADLWSIMNVINPGLLGTAARFAERFGNPIERHHNEAARARLRRLVSPFLLRRTKAQVLTDLPPRTEIIQRIEPSPDEQAFLEAMRREALARIAQLDPADPNKNRFNVLAELTRLRRAACDPRLAAPEFGRVGAKVQAFERLAVELVQGRHQALVFSQFTDFLKLLAERLDAAGLRYQMLDGSTPAAARAGRVAAFQRGDADLFLISLKAGGFGLNLTAADYVVIADPWWNPAAEDQAMGRAHRIGQQRPVTVYRLVTAGSVEERIVALHGRKRELAEGLLADQDGTAPLAAEQLIDLLRDVG